MQSIFEFGVISGLDACSSSAPVIHSTPPWHPSDANPPRKADPLFAKPWAVAGGGGCHPNDAKPPRKAGPLLLNPGLNPLLLNTGRSPWAVAGGGAGPPVTKLQALAGS